MPESVCVPPAIVNPPVPLSTPLNTLFAFVRVNDFEPRTTLPAPERLVMLVLAAVIAETSKVAPADTSTTLEVEMDAAPVSAAVPACTRVLPV